MSDTPTIWTKDAAAPNAEAERIYNEILGGEKAGIAREAKAAQWTREAGGAANAAIDHVTENLPDGWTLKRTAQGGLEITKGSLRVLAALSSTLGPESWERAAEGVLAQVSKAEGRRR